ncbi:MAG: GNAT family N-acetyltransferase [Propionibacteriaceae bacterium]|nr:GNAT family N-acetyltransferase [Propionibacteriaceae bacterium]
MFFAPYEPDAHGVPLPDVLIRDGERADLGQTSSLLAQREGGDPVAWEAILGRRFDEDHQKLVVAEHAGEVIGYGWLAYLTPVADGGHGAPDGWYLSGVVVDPAHRRRGIGRRLTQARIDWVLARDEAVFYVVSARNRASRTMHAELGFEEVTEEFTVPGVVFANADGILCRLDPRPDAEVIDLASRRAR